MFFTLILLFSTGFVVYYFVRKKPGVPKQLDGAVLLRASMRSAPQNTHTDEQRRWIALSAGLAERNAAYIDSLATGLDMDELRGLFTDGYQIASPSKAAGAIEYCLSARESSLLAVVYGAFTLRGQPRQKEFLKEVAGGRDSYYREIVVMLDRLSTTRDSLRDLGVIERDEDIMRIGTVAWDAALACWFARCCYDLGYINEEEAWGYIQRADGMAQKAFSSWEGFAESFLIGRAIATGDMAPGIKAIVDGLLSKKKSPWLLFEW